MWLVLISVASVRVVEVITEHVDGSGNGGRFIAAAPAAAAAAAAAVV